jgi:outer membrane protein assembly factor BamB
LAKNKTAITIALFLMATIAVTLVALPAANAHDPPVNHPAYCFAAVRSSTLGVNQEQLITFWLHDVPPTAAADSRYGDRWIFFVDITTPSGEKETLGGSDGFKSDPVGGSYTTYIPTEIGEYTVVARMPEYTITGLPSATGEPIDSPYVNDTYGPATSDPVTFTVQEEPIEPWPESPLPTEYWTRPINMANRKWYELAGDWLAGSAQDVGPTERFAYGPGPESAHVMWSRPYWAGGIMDERLGDIGYQTAHYGGLLLTPPIIIDGKIYYTEQATGHTRSGYICIDLFTGETLSYNEDVTLSFASIYDYESPNQHGGFPYLWVTSGVTLPEGYTTGPGMQTWEMLDAHTARSICKIANVTMGRSMFGRITGGFQVYGQDGSILNYNIADLAPRGSSTPDYYLQVWNTSAIDSMLQGTTGTNFWQWRPQRLAVHDGSTGFSLNVSISPVEGSIIAVREGVDIIGGTTDGYNDDRGVVQNKMWALSLEPDKEGEELWSYSYTPPKAAAVPNEEVNSYRGMRYDDISPEDGVFIFREQLTRKYWGFDLKTGKQLWESEPENQMMFYGLSTSKNTNIYDGKFYSYGYGGEITAYNITTGEVLWRYIAENVGFESPYGNYPIGIACIADGKLYTTTSEHSVTSPLFRGSYIRCLDADNGTELWKILHWSDGIPGVSGRGVFIADGFIVSLNFYDNKLYCYGKGPSATTVSIQNDVITHGNGVLIKGMVTDTAPGTTQTEQAGRFPNGVPAICDEDQEAWMEYVYSQQLKPKNATGVEVKLETLDPNGNFYEIGTTTSDASGMYSYMFTPEVPGKYTIIATFEGSKSYYGSSSETALGVEEAPQATQATPTPPPEQSMADIYFLPFSIGLLIAIVAVGLVIILMLRKR